MLSLSNKLARDFGYERLETANYYIVIFNDFMFFKPIFEFVFILLEI